MNKMMKIIMFAVLLVVIIFVLVNTKHSFVHNDTAKKKSVYMIVKSTDPKFEFWSVVKAGAEAAAKEFNVDLHFTGPDDEQAVQQQIDILSDTITKKPSAIILAAADFKALVPMAEKAVKEKITLVTMDSNIDSNVEKSFIATDNVAGAQAAGEKLAELLEGKGKVAVVSYVQGTTTAIQREKGFLEAVSKYTDINCTAVKYSNGNVDEAYRITKKIIEDEPDIKGIFGANQPSAEGVARAVKEMGLQGKVKIVAFDNSEEQIQYIEDEIIQAVIIQKPYNMGYLSVKTAAMASNGERVEKYIDTGYQIITRDNMYVPEIQKLLFPFVENR